ncbi:MAG: luciferase family protein [Nitrososphaerales archaeon]
MQEVSKWDGVAAALHSFGGTEFLLGRRELGHVHGDSWADIAFSMEVRNQLVEEKSVQFCPKIGDNLRSLIVSPRVVSELLVSSMTI